MAQAFINHDTYGILCSLDTDVDPNSWYETILHEMVHIYCTTHESNGDNFFDKYCVNKKNNFKDGTMGAAELKIAMQYSMISTTISSLACFEK